MPLVVSPANWISYSDPPSANTLSPTLVVGFCPLEAYTPVQYTAAVFSSKGNRIVRITQVVNRQLTIAGCGLSFGVVPR